ncbi:MAG TPA: glycosyltransferase [Gemmata sp.]|nr:glycosyltransferase [Gemmata sp.]
MNRLSETADLLRNGFEVSVIEDGKQPSACLVAPGAPSSNPRLVKEANALAAAGFRVRVVCGTGHSLGAAFDAGIPVAWKWEFSQLPSRGKWQRFPQVIRQRISAKLAWRGWVRTTATSAWAESEFAGRLARAASAEPADIYIGHYLPGLYAAWKAARCHNAVYGFDAEDSHVDELPDTSEFRGRRESRMLLERELLTGCQHLTAASPLIAETYVRRYGKRPLTVLNVFPLAEAPSDPVQTPYLKGEGPPTLYWFSQTVGSGRGLEQIVAAMGRMTVITMLHLRGNPASGYRQRLEAHAAACGASGRVIWHPPASPDEMVRIAAGHDLGLALELTDPPNRAICLTNKAFTYLLAGIPTVFSRTPAQEWLAGEVGSASLVTDLDDPVALASQLDGILVERDRLAARRATAWRIGRERFNWDAEQGVFLRSVRDARGVVA